MKIYDLSIIIPVFNASFFVEKCIENVSQISKLNYELIIIDDGSSDNTFDVCKKIKKINNKLNISIYSKTNGGVSSARNFGLKKAKGKYVYFMDVDDDIDVKAFEVAFNNCMNEHPSLYVFGMNFIYFKNEKQTRKIKKCTESSFLFEANDIKDIFWDLYDKNYLSSVWNKFFLKEVIDKNKMSFNCEMHIYEDLLFSIEFISKSKKIHIDQRTVYNYFIDENYKVYKKRKSEGIEKNIEHITKGIDVFFENMDIQDFASINRKKIFFIYLWYLSILIYEYHSKEQAYKYLKKVVNLVNDRAYLNNIKVNNKRDKILFWLIKHKLYLVLYIYIKIKVMVK